MTTPVVTLRQDDHVRRAAQVLLEHLIASAPVIDEHESLVGIVSEADLLRGRTEADPRAHLRPVGDEAVAPPTTVAAVMASLVVTVRADEDVAEASRLLLGEGVKALPVVDGRQVVGVVARRDLLRCFAREDDDVRADVLRLLTDLGMGDEWQVEVRDGVVDLATPDRPDRQRAAAVLARTVPGVVRVQRADGST